MKVLYISHAANLSGAPRSLLEFVSVIHTKGIHPIVVLPEHGELERKLEKIGIDIRIIPYQVCVCFDKYKMKELINYLKVNITAIRRIIKIIQKEKIDIVHSNSLAVDVGAIASYFANVPHIWHLREYLEEDFDYKIVSPKLEKWLIRKSAYCIAISKGIKEKYDRTYNIRTILMYNGVNRHYYSKIQETEQDNKIIKMLIAGTIVEGKGQWDAIRAIKKLRKEKINIHLSIVGDGVPSYVNQLKKYVKENGLKDYITFFCYTSDLQQLRLDCSIMLVCSRMEAFGRVTAEGMMAGKIVIGSNTGGTAELIGRNEQRGYLYIWNNPDELAEKIKYVISHSSEVMKKRKKAQKFILRITDLDVYTTKLKRIYDKVQRKYQRNL